MQKPFLKWVGGKTQILDAVLRRFPQTMNNYHELFLGGGSVLLALLSLQKQGKLTITGTVHAYDINISLINVYKQIQSNKDNVYQYIQSYITEYDSITGDIINRKPETIEDAKTSKESYYYWIRKKFNSIKNSTDICTAHSAALFMFINKTCFRGMYREGPNGYNVPYGHYKKTPTIITQNCMDIISDLIKDVIFIHSDFTESINNVKTGDAVYLDPPYAPRDTTSFVGYVANGFPLEKHQELFEKIKTIAKTGCKFIMSNANVEMVTESFTGYTYDVIIARRAIHSKNPGATATEVIIYN